MSQRPSDEALMNALSPLCEPQPQEGLESPLHVWFGVGAVGRDGSWEEAMRDLYDQLAEIMFEIETYDEAARRRRAWRDVSGRV